MTEMQRRPTLMDVAQAAGVSRALVSIVMRGAPGAAERTRERVLTVARDLGYRPDSRARLLRSSRTRLLGVTFHGSAPFHAEIVDAVYAQAAERGYEVVLSAVGRSRSEARAIDGLLDFGSEALIVIAPSLGIRELERYAGRVPVVSLLRDDVGAFVDSISSDDRAGVRVAVEHLTGLGHWNIVHVDGGSAVSAARRRDAFRLEMMGRQLEPVIIPGGPGEDDGLRAGDSLQGSLPSAVIAFNDRSALGVMESLRAAGLRVPEDVSVLGFDNSQLAQLRFVQLSSVSSEAPLLAVAAVDRAVDRLEGRGGPVHVVSDPRLIVRSTTAPPAEAWKLGSNSTSSATGPIKFT
ncbi:DNA-binding LacI/PurR family transcriptional regulator [Arthrobacter sp. V4I6]|nr:DNA-binding LacI/PurR family transcriptional regulator [Arthrobacter sp. V1I7]MDQ0852730.1 DNA-binding LacI/PurR family transcriptional regulator [Arthrobacter sp. V4I6]